LAAQKQGGSVWYVRGACPVADDLFNRAVFISLDLWYSPTDCHNIVAGINKVLSAYCTEDLDAAPWS
jgi:hypothetical protein